MRVDKTTNETVNRNLDETPKKILPHVSIPMENESELWHKTWNLYINAARSPIINDPKRKALLQLAESDSVRDAKEKYARIIKPTKIQQKTSSQAISIASKWKVKLSEIEYNENFISCLTILQCFAIIIGILIIVLIFLSILVSTSVPRILIDQGTHTKSMHEPKIIEIAKTTTPLKETKNSSECTIVIKSPIDMRIIKPAAQDLIKYNSILVVLICLLFLIICFIISCWLDVRQILICICCIPCRLYRLIFTPSQNIRLPFMHKIEKLVLLDSMTQQSHLSRLFQDNLLVYSSIYDCFHQLASNHLQDYILFLSLTNFEVHSSELERLSNVSLCIFYEDNDHSPPHISKTKYHIRFIFPKACLLVYVRHAVILNYIKQAHMYRLEGLERETDENCLAASRECHRLADELEQQSSTTGGREPQEVLSYDIEDMNDPILTTTHF